jgi:competence protein ComEC
VSGNPLARPARLLAAALAAGIFLGDFLPGPALPAWIAAGVCLFRLVRDVLRRSPALFSPLILFFLLGYLSIQPWSAPRFTADHLVHYAERYYPRIHGRILTPPETDERRVSFVMASVSLGPDVGPVTGNLRVTAAREGIPPLRQGDEIRFSGRVRRIRSLKNPGGFDYARFMAFREIHCTAYIRKGSLRVLTGSLPSVDRAAASRPPAGLRERIHARIRQSRSADAGAVMAALLIGEKGQIDPDLRNRFNRAGIGHLLAISGLHVGIVTAFAYAGFRWLLAFVPPLLWRGWLRKAAALAALFPVFVYAHLAQWSPATQRAVCMAAAVCLSLWFGRESDVGNGIALAVLVILAAFPPALFAISFQLSFAAVIAIVAGMSAFARRPPADRGRLRSLGEKAGGLTAVSLLATLGTLPLCMIHFNRISFIGIIANLFFIPWVGGLVLPLGLLAVFVFPVAPDLAGIGFDMCGRLLDLALMMLPLFSELPFGAFVTIVPTAFEVGLYYVVGGLLLAEVSARQGGKTAGRRRRMRWLWGAVAVAVLADGLYWTHDRFFRDDLRVTVIDVGQGSAALVEFPRGYRMLIDGGGYYDPRVFDVGSRVVAPLLRRRRILTLDAVVLSHPDSDHLNGLIPIVEQFRVKSLWTTGMEGYAEADNVRALMAAARQKCVPTPAFESLARKTDINGVALEIFYPPHDVARTDPSRMSRRDWRRKSNNRSMVIGIRLGDIGILFPGDIERRAEKVVTAAWGSRLQHRVLVAPHHGSRTSSSPDFLAWVRPQYVLISAGRGNRFGCPHPEVLTRYRDMGARILRTDTAGALTLTTDGRRLFVGPAVP